MNHAFISSHNSILAIWEDRERTIPSKTHKITMFSFEAILVLIVLYRCDNLECVTISNVWQSRMCDNLECVTIMYMCDNLVCVTILYVWQSRMCDNLECVTIMYMCDNIVCVIILYVWQSRMCDNLECVTILFVWQSCICDDLACVTILHVWQSCICDNLACVTIMIYFQTWTNVEQCPTCVRSKRRARTHRDLTDACEHNSSVGVASFFIRPGGTAQVRT